MSDPMLRTAEEWAGIQKQRAERAAVDAACTRVRAEFTAEGMVVALTDRQMVVYEAIVSYWREHGCGPSVRDLMESCGIESPNGVDGHLKSLVAKGAIEREGTSARMIWPVGLRGRIRALLEVQAS